MTGSLEAAANVTGQTQKAFVEIQNPAIDAAVSGEVSLSPAARDALSSLKNLESNLQTEFDAAKKLREKDVAATSVRSKESEDGMDVGRLEQATQTMAQQMDVAMRVQQQLAQFVMVSSVSSSFGRNLNMFLRGQ